MQREANTTVVAVANVVCPDVLMSRIPILRSIAQLLTKGSAPPVETVGTAQHRTLPVAASLRINDGSCVANLQVSAHFSIEMVMKL